MLLETKIFIAFIVVIAFITAGLIYLLIKIFNLEEQLAKLEEEVFKTKEFIRIEKLNMEDRFKKLEKKSTNKKKTTNKKKSDIKKTDIKKTTKK